MKQQQNIEHILTESFREIVNPLIRYPQDLAVWTTNENDRILIKARPNFADFGKIRGSGAKTIEAINEIMELIGKNYGYVVKVIPMAKPIVGEMEPRTNFMPQKNWDSASTIQTLRDILVKVLNEQFTIECEDSGFSSTLIINLSKSEKLPIAVGQLGFTLGTIFHAIGKNIGRDLSIRARTKQELAYEASS